MRRRVEVHESGSEAYGQLQLVATKTYERRTVAVPASLIDELAEHLAGAAPDDFVWHDRARYEGLPARLSHRREATFAVRFALAAVEEAEYAALYATLARLDADSSAAKSG